GCKAARARSAARLSNRRRALLARLGCGDVPRVPTRGLCRGRRFRRALLSVLRGRGPLSAASGVWVRRPAGSGGARHPSRAAREPREPQQLSPFALAPCERDALSAFTLA